MKKIVIIILMCIASQPFSCGACTLNQNLILTVPSAINITGTGTNLIGTINIDSGANSGVAGQFRIQTNGNDNLYNYILQAHVKTQGNVDTNAYGLKDTTQYIVLGNNDPSFYPTTNAVNNIANATQGNNPNVIAYPVTSSVSGLLSITLKNTTAYGGYHYKVLIGRNCNGYVNQSVNPSPIANTYFYGEDKPGTYQAILIMSAFRKP